MSELATREPGARAPSHVAGVEVDYAAVLRTLKLDPERAETQALMLVCERYGLDPLLRHVVLIDGRPYVTRDGLLHVAHASGELDGMEVVEERETPQEWRATVAVYRRGMSRPFRYGGRYSKQGRNKAYGPEMALKTAESMALRRAFDVALASADEREAQPEGFTSSAPAALPTAAPADDPERLDELVGQVIERVEELMPPERHAEAVEYAERSIANAERMLDRLDELAREQGETQAHEPDEPPLDVEEGPA